MAAAPAVRAAQVARASGELRAGTEMWGGGPSASRNFPQKSELGFLVLLLP